MDITTMSTMRVNEEDNTKVLHFRDVKDMVRAVESVTADRSTVLYKNTCGFAENSTAAEIVEQMLADQELYKKEKGLRIRMNEITASKNELNSGREVMEMRQIADSMAAYYAAEGNPTVYDVWKKDDDTYKVTYAIGVVSPVDGKKYTWNNESKKAREQMALDTIAYKVTGKNRPNNEFNFLIQDNH